MFTKSRIASLDETGARPREAESERRNVSRGRARGVPGATPPDARDPLLGERRLSISSRRDKRSDAGLRFVEKREETRPLDNPAALESADFGDCRRRRHLLTEFA
jgi:hypothetical protein